MIDADDSDLNYPYQLTEIASWHIISELQHFNSGGFIVAHSGPCQYNCLDLYDRELGQILAINRNGSFHFMNSLERDRVNRHRSPEPIRNWRRRVFSCEAPSFIEEVAGIIGLKIPTPLPPINTSILLCKFISLFLRQTLFMKGGWNCTGGYVSSAYTDGPAYEFKDFPAAKERLEVSMPDDHFKEPGFRFWFIRRGCDPLLCLETTGTLWTITGKSYDLMELYRQNGNHILPLVEIIAGELV